MQLQVSLVIHVATEIDVIVITPQVPQVVGKSLTVWPLGFYGGYVVSSIFTYSGRGIFQSETCSDNLVSILRMNKLIFSVFSLTNKNFFYLLHKHTIFFLCPCWINVVFLCICISRHMFPFMLASIWNQHRQNTKIELDRFYPMVNLTNCKDW
jgi:hypothetical protein